MYLCVEKMERAQAIDPFRGGEEPAAGEMGAARSSGNRGKDITSGENYHPPDGPAGVGPPRNRGLMCRRPAGSMSTDSTRFLALQPLRRCFALNP